MSVWLNILRRPLLHGRQANIECSQYCIECSQSYIHRAEVAQVAASAKGHGQRARAVWMPAGLVGAKHITSAQARPQQRNLSCVATTPPRAVYESIITGDDELPILSMHLEATAPADRARPSCHAGCPNSGARPMRGSAAWGGNCRHRTLMRCRSCEAVSSRHNPAHII